MGSPPEAANTAGAPSPPRPRRPEPPRRLCVSFDAQLPVGATLYHPAAMKTQLCTRPTSLYQLAAPLAAETLPAFYGTNGVMRVMLAGAAGGTAAGGVASAAAQAGSGAPYEHRHQHRIATAVTCAPRK
jgi:hypothetical protein